MEHGGYASWREYRMKYPCDGIRSSYCFANMIGYTGQISQEEYDALSKKEQENYSLTDTVGKSGPGAGNGLPI